MAQRKSYLKINQSKLVSLLIAIGIVVVAGAILFEVRVSPRKWVARLRQIITAGQSRVNQVDQVSYQELADKVIPVAGKTVLVEWGSMGQKLVQAGAIDMVKFKKIFPELTEEQRQVLEGDDLHQITFTAENIGFWTDVLWALGLTQESKVLSEGPMQQNATSTPLKNYASTAGWTLGKKDAMALYNSGALIELTPEQDELVYQVASNIYRPCCGNSAAYPDCNHGMAVLGLLELMASQGAGEQEMYEAALAFNSYAFADTYINAVAYLIKQGRNWDEVEPKELLGANWSSGQGANFVAKSVGEIPGAPKRGGSCGV
jgi:hypothetical protein